MNNEDRHLNCYSPQIQYTDAMREQQEVCKRFGAPFVATPKQAIAGVARNLNAGLLPVNGLRHPSSGNVSGWYIWAGNYSNADNFFEPMHVAHLDEICPSIVKYLGLAPGWRFLVAGDYVDVWPDDTLLAASASDKPKSDQEKNSY